MRVLPFLLLPLPFASMLPTDAVAAIQRDELAGSRALSIVRSLCDEVGPRPAGSPGDRAAVSWAARTMHDLGLSNVRAESVRVTHWERGEGRADVVSPVAQSLVVTALGGSVGTPAAGVTAEVVEAASVEELVKLGRDAVRGKMVFLDPVMRRTRDGAGYGEAVRSRFVGAREAAKLGAVALLLRSVGTDHDRLPHTGAKAKDDHEIPAAAISVPDAEMLHRLLVEKKSVRVHLVLGAHAMPDAESANVVGEVLGREKPAEIVLLGAHLDSWDLGTGAVDDGAGVAIVLEAARLLQALPRKPRRTVRVVLFANEEHGLQGAREYARVHAAEAGAHVVAFEADLGADEVYAVRWLGDPAARERFVDLARLLA
ncbi:MAG TPA: M20/M25/M40 family metallo-hydrolase, partial [Polyangiaceae bacterium]|nr:M20/M25/M40 family metallo-hydrolase [Polyangiaceae bacterium]